MCGEIHLFSFDPSDVERIDSESNWVEIERWHIVSSDGHSSIEYLGTTDFRSILPSDYFKSDRWEKMWATEVPNQCFLKYCNSEAVTWWGENQLMLVSIRSKKDQSIHDTKLVEELGSPLITTSVEEKNLEYQYRRFELNKLSSTM